MFATGVTMGLAEWIIDDTCFVLFLFFSKLITSDSLHNVLSITSLSIHLFDHSFGWGNLLLRYVNIDKTGVANDPLGHPIQDLFNLFDLVN